MSTEQSVPEGAKADLATPKATQPPSAEAAKDRLMTALDNLVFYIANSDDEPMKPRMRLRMMEARAAIAFAEGRYSDEREYLSARAALPHP